MQRTPWPLPPQQLGPITSCKLLPALQPSSQVTQDNIVRAIGVANVDQRYNAAVLLDDSTIGFIESVLDGIAA
jgi:hypothetical protein